MQEGAAGVGGRGATCKFEVPWTWKLIDPEKKDPKVRCCKLLVHLLRKSKYDKLLIHQVLKRLTSFFSFSFFFLHCTNFI